MNTMDATNATNAPEVHQALRTLTALRSRHLAFVRRRLSHRAEPEDILQIALLRASRHLDELREGDKIEAWFWRILRNTIADENERAQRDVALLQRVHRETETISTPADTSTCTCSLGVLETLKPEYRDVIQRNDVDEEPLDHIASDAGITLNNATVRLHRARKAMRQALVEHCGACSTSSCQHCSCDG
jgi:RNA polymerase sigma-70 factor (ECF subfamily)